MTYQALTAQDGIAQVLNMVIIAQMGAQITSGSAVNTISLRHILNTRTNKTHCKDAWNLRPAKIKPITAWLMTTVIFSPFYKSDPDFYENTNSSIWAFTF